MYVFTVLVFTLVMIYVFAPRYGRTNPIIYISICSLVGSVSIMAIKGFGVALKLTFNGNNQFGHPSTYVFAIVVVVCIVVQMNYFNKALDIFSTNVCVYIPVNEMCCGTVYTNVECTASIRCTTSASQRQRLSPPSSSSRVSTQTTVLQPYPSFVGSLLPSWGYISSTSVVCLRPQHPSEMGTLVGTQLLRMDS